MTKTINQQEIERRKHWAEEQLKKNGLRYYTMHYRNLKVHYGFCYHETMWKPGKIIIATRILEEAPRSGFEDVFFHEIAHAIAGPEAKHGPKWKAVAKSLGAKPNRVADPYVARAKPLWIGRCKTDGCGVYYLRHRLGRKVRTGMCHVCYEKGVKDILTWSKLTDREWARICEKPIVS